MYFFIIREMYIADVKILDHQWNKITLSPYLNSVNKDAHVLIEMIMLLGKLELIQYFQEKFNNYVIIWIHDMKYYVFSNFLINLINVTTEFKFTLYSVSLILCIIFASNEQKQIKQQKITVELENL